jgi:hypothetical protein
MIRIFVLTAACVICLCGCFVFDNPVESGGSTSAPTVTFQVVITSATCGGTYVWNSHDNAYEAVLSNVRYFVYQDSSGAWCLSAQLGGTSSVAGSVIASSTPPPFRALPPTSGSGWSPTYPAPLTSIDDSAGGISAQGSLPDNPITQAQILKVGFLASDPGNLAKYQWESMTAPGSFTPVPGETGSTFKSPGVGQWVRVMVTPTDGTGTINGVPVESPPVFVSG